MDIDVYFACYYCIFDDNISNSKLFIWLERPSYMQTKTERLHQFSTALNRIQIDVYFVYVIMRKAKIVASLILGNHSEVRHIQMPFTAKSSGKSFWKKCRKLTVFSYFELDLPIICQESCLVTKRAMFGANLS